MPPDHPTVAEPRPPAPSYNLPKSLKQWHYELLLALLAGHSVTDAAKALGRSYTRAYVVSQSPLFQHQMRTIRQTQLDAAIKGDYGVKGKLRAAEGDMADIVINLAKNARNEAVRLNAATDVLDRTGHAPVKQQDVKITVDHVIKQMTNEELETFIASGTLPSRLEEVGRRAIPVALPAPEIVVEEETRDGAK
jgi:hypothetical protein